MSVLIYGGVRCQIQKTEHFGFGPVYSEDGADYLHTELDLAVCAVVNPQALATQGTQQIAGGPPGLPGSQGDEPAQANGDSVGISLRNLRAMLLTPRQELSFSIGGDVVITIPAGGDARNGPLPQRDTYIRWIAGTKTAYVYFHVKAWLVEWVPQGLSTAFHVVLSNRYRVTSVTDEDFYSRRHIAGQMVIDPSRLSALAAGGILTPDNFRAGAFLSIPAGFKRDSVQVTVSSDNTTLDYSYVDQETPLSLGARCQATRIEAFTTCGITDTLGSLSGLAAAAAAAAAAAGNDSGALGWGAATALGGIPGVGVKAAWELAKSQFGMNFDMGGALAHGVAVLSGAALPKIVGTGIARLWGQRNSDKGALAQLGIQILLDRFTTGDPENFGAYFSGNTPRIGSITIMQDVKERMVEVQMSFVPTLVTSLLATGFSPATLAPTLMNMGTPVKTNGLANADPTLSGQIAQANPAPPLSAGTRGDWLQALIVALLAQPGIAPIAPVDPFPNIDAPLT